LVGDTQTIKCLGTPGDDSSLQPLFLLLWTRLVADGYFGDPDSQTDAPVHWPVSVNGFQVTDVSLYQALELQALASASSERKPLEAARAATPEDIGEPAAAEDACHAGARREEGITPQEALARLQRDSLGGAAAVALNRQCCRGGKQAGFVHPHSSTGSKVYAVPGAVEMAALEAVAVLAVPHDSRVHALLVALIDLELRKPAPSLPSKGREGGGGGGAGSGAGAGGIEGRRPVVMAVAEVLKSFAAAFAAIDFAMPPSPSKNADNVEDWRAHTLLHASNARKTPPPRLTPRLKLLEKVLPLAESLGVTSSSEEHWHRALCVDLIKAVAPISCARVLQFAHDLVVASAEAIGAGRRGSGYGHQKMGKGGGGGGVRETAIELMLAVSTRGHAGLVSQVLKWARFGFRV
jgi:hypothetical protein